MARASRSDKGLRPGAPVSDANARLLARFEGHLAARPVRTQEAYRRDVAALAALAGERPLEGLTRPELSRHLATLHGRGLSGRSLARMLSAWRSLYRYLLDRERGLKDDPTAGLKPPKSAVVPYVSLPYVTKEGAGGPDPGAPARAACRHRATADSRASHGAGRHPIAPSPRRASIPGAGMRGTRPMKKPGFPRALSLPRSAGRIRGA